MRSALCGGVLDARHRKENPTGPTSVRSALRGGLLGVIRILIYFNRRDHDSRVDGARLCRTSRPKVLALSLFSFGAAGNRVSLGK